MIKTAVIGYGFSAKTFHLPFIEASEKFQLVSISTSKLEQVRTEWSDITSYKTAQELIQESDAQLVVITAPNDVHYSLAKLCLQHGKHVIIEKPMVTTVHQGEELVSLAKAQGLLLSVYHNRRWDGDFLTVKRLIQDGLIGRVRFFESHFDRFRPIVKDRWREQPGPGTGNWFDLGSHLLDQALCLFGMPQAVTARCLALRDNSKTTDYFHVMLHYSDCEVVLHGSPFSAGPNLRFQVQGTKGSFIKYGYDPQEELLKLGRIPNTPQWAEENKELFGTVFTEAGSEIVPTMWGSYQSYYSGIADAINAGKAIPVSGEDALQVINLLKIAEKSYQLGKTIVLTPQTVPDSTDYAD
jgi:predicted dehydrogenase